MLGWLQVTLVALSIGILIVFLCVIIQRSCRQKKRKDLPSANQERAQNLQNGIAKLHHVSIQSLDQDHSGNNRNNYYVFRRGVSTKPFFSWADHPSLITDAVENGWSRFAFSPHMSSSPSVRAARSLLGACAAGDQARELEVETSWEVCQGSADFMQKIRFNRGLEKIISSNNFMAAVSVIKTALPLPGPPLGNSSFPQEAYFEITILSPHDVDQELISKANEDRVDGDRIKLIREDFNAKSMSDNLIHVTSTNGYGNNRLDEVKHAAKEDGKIEAIIFSVGLTGGGGTPPLKLPGSFPGSIGFNSNGSVFLDGTKLVFESEKESWGRPEHVIGCGYNPSQKKVFFTVNSQLVHEIHCKSEAFGTPLYPTLAANADVLVLVNLGQRIFKYPPANLQRTPNPCFIGPLANSPALGYEDSRELFSMGRIDAQWLHRSTTRSTNASNGYTIKGFDYDEESEGDLFEIVLDSSGRSPYASQH